MDSGVLEFRLLGPLEVRRDGGPVSLTGGKQRTLLALLLLRANEVVARDTLIEELFGGAASEAAANALQASVSRLRKLLGAEVISTRPAGYAVVVELEHVDLFRFEQLAEAGRNELAAGQPARAATVLREALALWRGSPLQDVEGNAVDAEVRRLEELRLAARMDLIDADLALGRGGDLVGKLKTLTAEEPYQERLRGQLMLALYRAGRQADALEVYRDTRRLLVEELGIEPASALQRLERAILVQDPSLASPPPAEPFTDPWRLHEVTRSDRVPKRRVPRLTIPPLRHRRHGLLATGGLLLAFAIAALVIGLAGGSRETGLTPVAPNSVAAIDPESNQVVARVPVGDAPTRIVASKNGVWVINQDAQTLSLIDPGTRKLVRTLAIGVTPTDLAVDRHGIWVAAPDGTVSLVQPELLTVTKRFKVRVRPKVFSNDLPGVSQLASGFGSLWVGSGGRTLTRLDPATGSVVKTIGDVPTGNGNEGGIVAGSGSIWAADNFNTVTRIDPSSNMAERVQHGLTLFRISGLAAGDGNLWFSDVGNDRIWQLGTFATPRVIRSVSVGPSPLGVAIGHGTVWVVNSGDGTVMRIDPKSGKVVRTIEVGGAPVGITAAEDAVWVTVD